MLRQVVNTNCRCGASRWLLIKYEEHSMNIKRSSFATAASTQSVSEEWANAKPYEDLPGLKPWPIIGNTWAFLPIIGDLSSDIVQMQSTFYKKFGDICRLDKIPGRNNMVFIYKPEDIETVYRTEGPQPIRPSFESLGHYRTDTRKEVYDGIGGAIVAQGQEWQDFRTKMNPIMMQPRAIKPYVGPIDAVASDFIQRIFQIRDEKLEMPSNFKNELHKWALESIVYIALDTRLGCLENDLDPNSEPQRMINAVQDLFDTLLILEVKLSPWKVISTPAWRKFVKQSDYFNEVCTKYINQAAVRLKNSPADSDRELTILEKLLARDSNPKTAMVMALDMFFAGIETTAYSTANVLYFLSKHPEKQQILFEEVLKLIPEKSQPITPKITNELKYLKACIKEALRLRPIVSGNLRTTTKDIVLSGYRIPKETDVILPHNILCLMDKYFPEAEKFIPERWLKSGGDQAAAGVHPFVYMPFGFGPRMCLGRRFAEVEMETLLPKIIRNFKVEYHYEMKYESKLIYVPASPLKFKFIERN